MGRSATETVGSHTATQRPGHEDDDSQKPKILSDTSENSIQPGVLFVALKKATGLTIPPLKATNDESNAIDIKSPANQDMIVPCSDRYCKIYAILEMDGSQFSIRAVAGDTENPTWSTKRIDRTQETKFDAFRAAELVIRLYAKTNNSHEGSQDAFLGYARVTPTFRTEVQTEWTPIQNGTGSLHIEVQYVQNRTQNFNRYKKSQFVGESRFGEVERIQKSDSNSFYASIAVQKDHLSALELKSLLLSPMNNVPFVAPLRFITETDSHMSLFWPHVPGGHLLFHLQQSQRFSDGRARLYAAEILIAMERIGRVYPTYCDLQPKNILLDSVGHVVICDIGLWDLDATSAETTSSTVPDYLAPEIIGDGPTTTDTTASKWWTLGAILFEMLTGLPPFYDEDLEQRYHNTLSEALIFPPFLSEHARDLLSKLLVRQPDLRLGFHGAAAEIMAHPYFDGLDWNKVAGREYVPQFKPRGLVIYFRQDTPPGHAKTFEEMFAGFEYSKPMCQGDPSVPVLRPRPVVDNNNKDWELRQNPVVDENKEDWELRWKSEDRALYLYNRSSGMTKPIEFIGPGQAAQKTLDVVLKHKCMGLVPTILAECHVDPNFELSFTAMTPLSYLTELAEVELVSLLLQHGACANLAYSSRLGSRPLLKAVRRENRTLVQLLVQATDRVPCTAALGRAVEKQDYEAVSILLAHGVKCDFEDGDQPPPYESYSKVTFVPTCSFTAEDTSEPEEYLPPLVRAIYLGDAKMVQLLLSHGADANAGYHDLNSLVFKYGKLVPWFTEGRVYMTCGRAIQLAMELGRASLVTMLLEHGAVIDLLQHVRPRHRCEMVPRVVHHRITARLRSAAAMHHLREI